MDEQRLRALASAASVGPWSVQGNNLDEWYVYALHARYETLPGNSSPVKVAWVPWSPGTLRHEHDAAYIAARFASIWISIGIPPSQPMLTVMAGPSAEAGIAATRAAATRARMVASVGRLRSAFKPDTPELCYAFACLSSLTYPGSVLADCSPSNAHPTSAN